MTAPQQQRLRITGPVVVTANRLTDGAVLYFTERGDWSIELQQAAVTVEPSEAGNLLAWAAQDFAHAIEPYLAPVRIAEDGTLAPANLRERIRTAGPTIATRAATIARDEFDVRL